MICIADFPTCFPYSMEGVTFCYLHAFSVSKELLYEPENEDIARTEGLKVGSILELSGELLKTLPPSHSLGQLLQHLWRADQVISIALFILLKSHPPSDYSFKNLILGLSLEILL